jgi:hypothetical protein
MDQEIYSYEGLMDRLDSDSITDREAGFMVGFLSVT